MREPRFLVSSAGWTRYSRPVGIWSGIGRRGEGRPDMMKPRDVWCSPLVPSVGLSGDETAVIQGVSPRNRGACRLVSALTSLHCADPVTEPFEDCTQTQGVAICNLLPRFAAAASEVSRQDWR